MKKINSTSMLERLQADVRRLVTIASLLKAEDPAILLQEPAAGKWSVIQVIEHLNGYGRYYLRAIEQNLKEDKPAKIFFKPGWLGGYFTRLMKPTGEGLVKNKMQTPKSQRPSRVLDAFPVLNSFIEQQQYLLDLLEVAKEKNLESIRVPVSIAPIIKLKLGDTFGFLIAHEQRHFIQIANTLQSIKEKDIQFELA